MSEPAPMGKADCRRRLREERLRHPETECAAASEALRARIRRWQKWSEAGSVLGFHPLPGEPDLVPLLAESLQGGKLLALPAYDAASGAYRPVQVRDLSKDLVSGRFGVLEPRPECPVVPINRLDFAFVPGLGFDLTGGRLGRGQGFYDRLLKDFCGLKCGVAFEWQVQVAIPMERHDIQVDFLATPDRLEGAFGRGSELE